MIGNIFKQNKQIRTMQSGYLINTKIKKNSGMIEDLIVNVKLENNIIDIFINQEVFINVDNSINLLKSSKKELVLNSNYCVDSTKIIKPDKYNLKKFNIKQPSFKDCLNIKKGLYIPLVLQSSKRDLNIIDMYLMPSIINGINYVEIKLENIGKQPIRINAKDICSN